MVDTPISNTTQSATHAGHERRNRFINNMVLYLILTVSAIVALVPFYWMIATSMMSLGETINRRWIPQFAYEEDFTTLGLIMSESEGNRFGLYVPVTTQQDDIDDLAKALPEDASGIGLPIHVNYISAWEEANFSKYFLNSIIITGLTILGMLLTSIPAAYAFARIQFWGREVIFTLLLATLMIPESVTMIPNFLVARGDIVPLTLIEFSRDSWLSVRIGDNFASEAFITQFNAMATWIQLTAVSWLNRLPALTIPFISNAFSIFLLRQFFATVPDELWDAARIDGCGHLRFLTQIATPIARPAIVTVTLLTFINSWNSFLWPLLVTTRDTWRPLMVGLWTFVSEAGPETHLLMAGSVITILPMLIIYFFAQKTFTEGIATSGLKG